MYLILQQLCNWQKREYNALQSQNSDFFTPKKVGTSSLKSFFEKYSKNLKLTLLLRFHDFYQISVTKEFQQKIRKFYPSHFFGALFQNDCKSYENILSERNNQNETCQIFLSYILTKFQKEDIFMPFFREKEFCSQSLI